MDRTKREKSFFKKKRWKTIVFRKTGIYTLLIGGVQEGRIKVAYDVAYWSQDCAATSHLD